MLRLLDPFLKSEERETLYQKPPAKTLRRCCRLLFLNFKVWTCYHISAFFSNLNFEFFPDSVQQEMSLTCHRAGLNSRQS